MLALSDTTNLIERRYTPPPLPLSARTIGQGSPLATVQTDIACAFDRARLSQRVGIAPDSWQADLLRREARQIMLNCARQVGKSTTTATLAAHTAVYCPGEPILLSFPHATTVGAPLSAGPVGAQTPGQ